MKPGPLAAADAAWAEPSPVPTPSETAPADYPITRASDLEGRTVPERPWLVPGWLPRRQVTLLMGDGGVGKSLLGLQLQASMALGVPWIGLPVRQGRSIGIYTEDDEGELHARVVDIARSMNVRLAELEAMAWRSAVADPCELVELDGRGGVRRTPYFQWMEDAVQRMGAELVILDAAANLFGGDEIARRQVTAFIVLLRRLAVETDSTVVLLGHPSVAGMNNGTGQSGSTAWSNAVRSRLYMSRDAGSDPNPDIRILEKKKSNYASTGDRIRMRWDLGVLIPIEGPADLDRAATTAKADRVFLTLLKTQYEAAIWVCPSPTARNYAPTQFAKHPDREGFPKVAFEASMHRLLRSRIIETEQYGRPSERRNRLRIRE